MHPEFILCHLRHMCSSLLTVFEVTISLFSIKWCIKSKFRLKYVHANNSVAKTTVVQVFIFLQKSPAFYWIIEQFLYSFFHTFVIFPNYQPFMQVSSCIVSLTIAESHKPFSLSISITI